LELRERRGKMKRKVKEKDRKDSNGRRKIMRDRKRLEEEE
jgi:hypothetical protein